MYRVALLAAALIGSASVASAADLGSYKDEPVASYGPGFSWAGLYIGGSAGFGVGKTSGTPSIATESEELNDFINPFLAAFLSSDYDMNGAIYGAHVGYNFQRNNIVFGVEAGINGTDLSGSTDIVGLNLLQSDRSLDWYGTATARLGYAADKVLFYGFGGVAFGTVNTDISTLGVTWASGESDHVGWTAGLGVEYAMTDRFIVRVEYSHVDLGEETASLDVFGEPSPLQDKVDLSFDAIKVGASYKFGGREHEPLK
jgi:outer membrane immunogenic protein